MRYRHSESTQLLPPGATRELFDKTHTVVDVETRWANPFVLGQES